MNTDLDLLELAAKAAGIPIVPCTCGNPRWPFKHDEAKSGKRGHWNPLEDDGDALRLACDLGLQVFPIARTKSGAACSAVGDVTGELLSEVSDLLPIHTATRRAIVRAAAEIGWAMQEGGAA